MNDMEEIEFKWETPHRIFTYGKTSVGDVAFVVNNNTDRWVMVRNEDNIASGDGGIPSAEAAYFKWRSNEDASSNYYDAHKRDHDS